MTTRQIQEKMMRDSFLTTPAAYFSASVAALVAVMAVLPAQASPGPGLDFAAIDKDGNGQITQTEMQAYHSARLTVMDADKDGFISADEMAQQMKARMAERIDKMARHAIVDRDENGDGKLSADEMSPGKGMGRMFAKADQNGDGALTQSELDAMRDQMGERMQRGGGMDGDSHGGWGKHRGGDMGGRMFWPFGGDDEVEN